MIQGIAIAVLALIAIVIVGAAINEWAPRNKDEAAGCLGEIIEPFVPILAVGFLLAIAIGFILLVAAAFGAFK